MFICFLRKTCHVESSVNVHLHRCPVCRRSPAREHLASCSMAGNMWDKDFKRRQKVTVAISGTPLGNHECSERSSSHEQLIWQPDSAELLRHQKKSTDSRTPQTHKQTTTPHDQWHRNTEKYKPSYWRKTTTSKETTTEQQQPEALGNNQTRDREE